MKAFDLAGRAFFHAAAGTACAGPTQRFAVVCAGLSAETSFNIISVLDALADLACGARVDVWSADGGLTVSVHDTCAVRRVAAHIARACFFVVGVAVGDAFVVQRNMAPRGGTGASADPVLEGFIAFDDPLFAIAAVHQGVVCTFSPAAVGTFFRVAVVVVSVIAWIIVVAVAVVIAADNGGFAICTA